MTKILECPTCQEGKIYDRRVNNRDEEETQEPSLLDVKAYPTLNGLLVDMKKKLLQNISRRIGKNTVSRIPLDTLVR